MESDREVYYPPIFFVSVYMDELSTALNGCNVGCYVGYTCVNNVMHADGLVMFCPSSRWLQSFLLFDRHGFSHDIKYNSKEYGHDNE